jgi:hypothetical protein
MPGPHANARTAAARGIRLRPPAGERGRGATLPAGAHSVERKTHLARDADRLTAQASEGFVLIDAGEIQIASVAEQRAHFTRYFARVTFERRDDLEPRAPEASR